MLLNLAEGFTDIGCHVDLLMVKARSLHLEAVPPGLNIIPLRANHTWSSLAELAGYLQRTRPEALLAAKAGATFISPFIGRLDDIGLDGMELIEEIREIYDNYEFETEILAASIRHTMHIIECAKLGADVMTGPLSSIEGLLKHPLTDIGLEKFLADYRKGNP